MTAGESRMNQDAAGADPPGAIGFIQVAFAGHNRADDLGDPKVAAAGLRAAFAMLARAGVQSGRLLTGLAPGADVIAAKAWRSAGLGPAHAVFPFLRDEPDRRTAKLVESTTWLDGAATREAGRNPHLAQARWLIGGADLLVVVWTGRHARGAGGTADAVRLALEYGIPVLWVRPGAPKTLRLIQPQHLDEDFGFLEFLEDLRFGRAPLVRDATPEALHAALFHLGLPEMADCAPSDRRKLKARPQGPPRIAWPWRAYALFRRALGGRPTPTRASAAPLDLQAQPGFVSLTEAHDAADLRAQQLGAIHRSHQVILLGVAILAAAAGSSSAVWPSLKLTMVTLELILALSALAVWLDSERGQRHHRWGDARRLAEDLRLERAAWTLGVSTMPRGANLRNSAEARDARRRAGLPVGAFNRDRVTAWGAWVIDELVEGQAAYHRDQSRINGRISHRVHQLENLSFAALLVALVGYVLATVSLTILGLDTPHWLGGVVVMAGAIVPAIGAAGLALEATLSLGEQAQRSHLLAARLDALAADLGVGPGLERLQSAVKSAIRLQRVQEEHWTEEASRRRLFRGG